MKLNIPPQPDKLRESPGESEQIKKLFNSEKLNYLWECELKLKISKMI